MSDLITTQEAARILGVTHFTVLMKYIKRGLLPAELVNTGAGKGHTKYQIKLADVQALKARKDSGDPAFKPGPEPRKADGKAILYFPRSPQWAIEVRGGLRAEERAKILEHFLSLKETDPERFNAELNVMQGGY